MNMILDPEQNLAKHPEIMKSAARYDSTMLAQYIEYDQARALLEYLRYEADRPASSEESDFTFE